MSFRLKSNYQPTGDQPKAIEALVTGINQGRKSQVLLGVTGSGKTFTIANVIEKTQKPTLVIAHNKTLAAQLYQEFKEYFPDNAVCYFVSYYDFYQPEAYIPRTDTYIEKETEINEEIDKLRLQATTNLLTRKDVIVVASVSCIYNLGSPQEYQRAILVLPAPRKQILERLIDLQYVRNEIDFKRGTFRITGETMDIYPSYDDYGIRIENNKLTKFDPLTGKVLENLEKFVVYPAKHYITDPSKYKDVFEKIRIDAEKRVKELDTAGKILEAHRIKSRVAYDLEMIQEVGYVNGIENYSSYFDGRNAGDPPNSLLEYFTKDYLLVIDESHMTIPQIRGMYNGDQSRKQTLIDYGFRLPSAMDNRPLRFDEFQRRMGQTIFTSATPNDWEISNSDGMVVEQLIRPTGLVDPEIEVRPNKNQILDLVDEIKIRVEKKERVLVTTLTKHLSEDLAAHLETKEKLKVAYLHSDIETMKRTDILRRLRLGEFDVLVGINLLREGLDLPEVSLVAILDADKEGFLRSKTSLIQTMGRAARHVHGQVIMYADNMTGSMKGAIDEVKRRRRVQLDWNKKMGIIPVGINKAIRENLFEVDDEKIRKSKLGNKFAIFMEEELANVDPEQLTPAEKTVFKKTLECRMHEAAKILDFEVSAFYRDKIQNLKS